MFEPQISRVFGAESHSAPPEDGSLLDQIVEPGFPNLRGGQIMRDTVIVQGTKKCKRPGNIVITDNQRDVQFIVNIVI